MTQNEKIQMLIDKHEITEVLMQYSRAVDRMDRDLLRDVYWPDAYDDHLLYKGDIEGMIEFSFTFANENMPTQHLLGNVLIQMEDEDNAHSETYYQAFHDVQLEYGTRQDLILGGRYIDHFQKRDGVWKILKRTLSVEWHQRLQGTADWENGPLSTITTRGGYKPDDLLYKLNPMASS